MTQFRMMVGSAMPGNVLLAFPGEPASEGHRK
jgi:hypothetical protein